MPITEFRFVYKIWHCVVGIAELSVFGSANMLHVVVGWQSSGPQSGRQAASQACPRSKPG